MFSKLIELIRHKDGCRGAPLTPLELSISLRRELSEIRNTISLSTNREVYMMEEVGDFYFTLLQICSSFDDKLLDVIENFPFYGIKNPIKKNLRVGTHYHEVIRSLEEIVSSIIWFFENEEYDVNMKDLVSSCCVLLSVLLLSLDVTIESLQTLILYKFVNRFALTEIIKEDEGVTFDVALSRAKRLQRGYDY